MLLFVLGRQPEIGLSELRAVFGPKVQNHGHFALLDADTNYDFNRLGSVIKVAKVVGGSWNDIAKNLPDSGKVTLGFSTYGTKLSARELNRYGLDIKKRRGSVRLVPSNDPALSSAVVYHNKLARGGNKFEFILAKNGPEQILGVTIFVQDIDAYTFRDRSRPKRDARVGMLPPKLAQTMINLTGTHPEGSVILDPFCGTGVVLQEASLMNMKVYGTDLEPRMIEYTSANLDWLNIKYHLATYRILEVGDATDHKWQQPIDLVATETYLGRPFAVEPDRETLRTNINNCDIILSKFFKNLHSQISKKAYLTIAVPCWFVRRQQYHLPLANKLRDLGYEQIFYSDDKKPLIYHRDGQVVGRELLVLQKI